jgi:hypothetical protein
MHEKEETSVESRRVGGMSHKEVGASGDGDKSLGPINP